MNEAHEVRSQGAEMFKVEVTEPNDLIRITEGPRGMLLSRKDAIQLSDALSAALEIERKPR